MHSADVELEPLIGLFYPDPRLLGQFTTVAAQTLPAAANQLLAHDRHMTVTIEKFHQCPVDVKVIQHQADANHYWRKIVLARHTDHQVVMFGIVRLNLSLLSPAVQAEIEARETPLGRILISHKVLRSVKLRSLFRIQPGQELAQSLGLATGESCYGRTAMIYCDGQPAIELLEIVP